MKNYYAVERTGNSLSHYGVKGMKWGVQKAVQRGNSKALDRQYKKASKRMAKLDNRANAQHQQNIIARNTGRQKWGVAAGGVSLGLAGIKKLRGINSIPITAGVAGAEIIKNQVQKAKARQRLTQEGHAAAKAEANSWRNEMKSAFKGTKYANKTDSLASNIAKKKRAKVRSDMRFYAPQNLKSHVKSAGIGAVGGIAASNAYTANDIAFGSNKKSKKKRR